MSANIAVIYSGADVREVAEAFGEAAGQLSARVKLLQVPDREQVAGAPAVPGGAPVNGGRGDPDATLGDLEWADGIAFGTPVRFGAPANALMAFIERTEPLWSSGKLTDKVVSTFTDEPERFAPDPVVHPIYEALYQWGAVIVGPRAFELELDAQPRRDDPDAKGKLTAPRLRTAHYRGRRLAALARVLANERSRQARLEL